MVKDKTETKNTPFGEEAISFIDSFLTKEEIEASNIRVTIIQEMVKAREEKGLTQRKLETLSGVKQPIIARLEKGKTNPQLETILKILIPLGKTLKIVPLQ